MEQPMWTYLIHLSTNMWADEGGTFKLKPYYPEFHTDEKVWRQVVNFLPEQGFNTLLIDVGDAVQYESHPEIAVKGAWSKDRMKKELDYIRSLGLTPLPKLNFSACHDAWMGEYSKMLCTKPYYRVCADLIREVCEIFDSPSCFHLGLDEEGLPCQSKYSICHIRIGEQWWKDVYALFDECEKNGTRPWVWADPCWDKPQEYARKMPKSVLQSNWWYDPLTRKEDGSFTDPCAEMYHFLDREGYDQVPTASTWCYQFNIPETVEMCKTDLSAAHMKGMMAAPWQLTTGEDLYTLLDDANRFGYAKRAWFPDK